MKDAPVLLTSSELKCFRGLSHPIRIQDFLDTFPINWEKTGETCMSVRSALQANKVHCIEGAFIAALALWIHGHKPFLLDLKTITGDDHVVALYNIGGYWGAISKTNHATLRFRDPIFATVHDLALSYFHEYFDQANGKKILCAYSKPFDLRKYAPEWIIGENNLFHIADKLDHSIHYEIVPQGNNAFIRKADNMERKAGALIEWKKSDRRT